MKKSIFILDKYNELNKKIVETGEARDRAMDKYFEIYESCKVNNDIETIKLAQTEKESKMIELDRKLKSLNIYKEYLYDNLIACIVFDTLPAIKTVMNKYAGKKYGEKTKQKISDEVKKETGFSCYIDTSSYSSHRSMYIYSETFSPVITSYRDLDLYFKKSLLENNTIQEITDEDEKETINSFKERYVDDIDTRITEIEKTFNKMIELEKQLLDYAGEFNRLKPYKTTSIAKYNLDIKDNLYRQIYNK